MLAEMIDASPRLRSLAFDRNRGRSVARQTGVEAARGDVVLLIDDDVVAHGGLVSSHARHHTGRRSIVVVGYMPVADPTGTVSNLYAKEYENVCRRYDAGGEDAVLRNLWGGNISLSRDECLRVGLVSPGFENLYHEDTDFGLRCRNDGLRGVFDRSLKATHHHQRSTRQFLADAQSQGAGRELLLRRHPGSTKQIRSKPLGLIPPLAIRLVTSALAPLSSAPIAISIPALRVMRRIHMTAGAFEMRRSLEGP